MKIPFNRRFSALTLARIEALAKEMELSDTAVVEQAIKDLAERRGVVVEVKEEEKK